MAHELSIQNGKAEMFYYGERPWHGLGIAVDHVLTASEAIEAAGLDWLVEKREIFFRTQNDFGEPTYEQAKGFATVRTDLNIPLGVVSDKYQPIQNHEAFNFIDTLIASKEAKFHTAGALFNGEKVWMLAKLPGNIAVKGDDVVDKYLVLMNAHNGKSAMRVFFTPIRVVCMNTLRQAISSAETTVNIQHTGNVAHKVMEAQRILGIANDYFEQIAGVFRVFAGREITDEEFRTYMDNIVPELSSRSRNIRQKIESFYHDGAGSDLAGHTLWGAYNAVSEWTDHARTDYLKQPDRYIDTINFGSGAEIKTKAYTEALKLVG
jgi:phage/plasmid-like protein (TIGR03299 family)